MLHWVDCVHSVKAVCANGPLRCSVQLRRGLVTLHPYMTAAIPAPGPLFRGAYMSKWERDERTVVAWPASRLPWMVHHLEAICSDNWHQINIQIFFPWNALYFSWIGLAWPIQKCLFCEKVFFFRVSAVVKVRAPGSLAPLPHMYFCDGFLPPPPPGKKIL